MPILYHIPDNKLILLAASIIVESDSMTTGDSSFEVLKEIIMIWIIGCLLHDRTQAIRSAAIPRRPCIISLSSLPLSHPCPSPKHTLRVFSSPGWHHIAAKSQSFTTNLAESDNRGVQRFSKCPLNGPPMLACYI